MNFDPDHALALARDVRSAATAYPTAEPAPTARHAVTARLANALDGALLRLRDGGTRMSGRLSGVAGGAEEFVAAARGSDRQLARDLETLA